MADGIGEPIALFLTGNVVAAIVPGLIDGAQNIGMGIIDRHGCTRNGIHRLAVLIQAGGFPLLQLLHGFPLEKRLVGIHLLIPLAGAGHTILVAPLPLGPPAGHQFLGHFGRHFHLGGFLGFQVIPVYRISYHCIPRAGCHGHRGIGQFQHVNVTVGDFPVIVKLNEGKRDVIKRRTGGILAERIGHAHAFGRSSSRFCRLRRSAAFRCRRCIRLGRSLACGRRRPAGPKQKAAQQHCKNFSFHLKTSSCVLYCLTPAPEGSRRQKPLTSAKRSIMAAPTLQPRISSSTGTFSLGAWSCCWASANGTKMQGAFSTLLKTEKGPEPPRPG